MTRLAAQDDADGALNAGVLNGWTLAPTGVAERCRHGDSEATRHGTGPQSSSNMKASRRRCAGIDSESGLPMGLGTDGVPGLNNDVNMMESDLGEAAEGYYRRSAGAAGLAGGRDGHDYGARALLWKADRLAEEQTRRHDCHQPGRSPRGSPAHLSQMI